MQRRSVQFRSSVFADLCTNRKPVNTNRTFFNHLYFSSYQQSNVATVFYLMVGITHLRNWYRLKTFLVLFSDTAPVFAPHHIQCLSRFISIRVSTFLQNISPQRVFIRPTVSYLPFTFDQRRNNFRQFTLKVVSAFYFLINLTRNYMRNQYLHFICYNEQEQMKICIKLQNYNACLWWIKI